MIKQKLSRRIRITFDPPKKAKYSEKKKRFYEKYAFLVEETLKEPLFQKFLHKIIKNENIDITKIRDIQIKTFPYKKENGKRLAGKCNNKGTICLYPKGSNFSKARILNWREEQVNFYFKCRARAALIHEVLHIKYLDKEFMVKWLTRKYFKSFIQLKNTDVNKPKLLKTLFPKTNLNEFKRIDEEIWQGFQPKVEKHLSS